MAADPTLVELIVKGNDIRMKIDGRTHPDYSGSLYLDELDKTVANNQMAKLHTARFASIDAYLAAEATAGRYLYKLLCRSTSRKKPHQALNQALSRGRAVRLVLELDNATLREKPWELVAGVKVGGSSEPWGVHPRLWLGRRIRVEGADDGVRAPRGPSGSSRAHRAFVVARTKGRGVDTSAVKVSESLRRLPVASRHLDVGLLSTAADAPGRQGARPVAVYTYVGHGADTETTSADEHRYEWGRKKVCASKLKGALDALGGSSARLYVLLSCHGGGCFNSVANHLGTGFEQVARSGAPVVVATQAVFTVVTAPAVASTLFTFLAKGHPIDEAVRNARRLARRVQLSLIETRHARGVHCDCVYTWRQLTVAFGHERSLRPVTPRVRPPAGIGAAADATVTAELGRLRDFYRRLVVRAPAVAALGARPDRGEPAPALRDEQAFLTAFPKTGRFLMPFVVDSISARDRSECPAWHRFESLKMTVAAAVANLCDERELEEIV